MKKNLFYTALAIGMFSGALDASACLCGPNTCPPCWDAIIEGFPVEDPASLSEQGGKLAGDASSAVASEVQVQAKQKINQAKSSVGTDLSSFTVPDTTLNQAFNTGETFTVDLSSNLLPQSASLTEEKDQNAAIATAKGENNIDEVMIQVEKSQLSTNATLAGEIYETEKRAYMRQENLVDAYAKVLLMHQNLDELVEKMDKEIDQAAKPGEDINAALRANMAANSMVSQLLSLYQQIVAARLQLAAFQKLEQVGTIQRSVVQSALAEKSS